MDSKAKRIIPVFASETEEANWWYEHREEIAQDLVEASRSGTLGEGTRQRVARMRGKEPAPAVGERIASSAD